MLIRLACQSLLVLVSACIFAAISYAPFYFWEQAGRTSARHQELRNIDWIMGPTMIIWGPLTVAFAATVACGFAYLLWPKRKVAAGDLANTERKDAGLTSNE